MIKVAVAGYAGRMGSAVIDAVGAADDMVVACGIDPNAPDRDFPVFAAIDDALSAVDFDVLVDFTQPSSVYANLAAALAQGKDCVVGTTGLTNGQLEKLSAKAAAEACLFYAPNFTTGAVLMMQFAKVAAPFFPEAEVIEFHHCNKKDAPSGTAVRTAQMIAQARDGRASQAPGRETEMEGMDGARGAL
ncbi:MAG: 4-hydroxy-tetrahydrodipicolinate reductase, partial [Berryella intestinalis]|nr:4-hydroxy-tetrahydrodipicolinate reductase [Berryella intestinalis]